MSSSSTVWVTPTYCLIRQIASNKAVLLSYAATCNYSSNTFTISQPLLHNYLDNTLYEIVIAGQPAASSDLTLTFTAAWSGGTYAIQTLAYPLAHSPSGVQIGSFYYTTNQAAQAISLYFSFTISPALLTASIFPTSFIEF